MRIAQQPAASEPQARPRAAARACSSGWLMGRSSKLAAEVYGVSPACTVRISLSSGSCRPGAVDAAPSFSSGRSGAAAGAAASPPPPGPAAPAAPLSAPAAPLLAPPPAVPFVALALPPAAPSVVPSAAPRASTCARANSFPVAGRRCQCRVQGGCWRQWAGGRPAPGPRRGCPPGATRRACRAPRAQSRAARLRASAGALSSLEPRVQWLSRRGPGAWGGSPSSSAWPDGAAGSAGTSSSAHFSFAFSFACTVPCE